jgi:hypothetical protein
MDPFLFIARQPAEANPVINKGKQEDTMSTQLEFLFVVIGIVIVGTISYVLQQQDASCKREIWRFLTELGADHIHIKLLNRSRGCISYRVSYLDAQENYFATTCRVDAEKSLEWGEDPVLSAPTTVAAQPTDGPQDQASLTISKGMGYAMRLSTHNEEEMAESYLQLIADDDFRCVESDQ